MADCFISYSNEDAAFATAVLNDLQAHGLEVFMAKFPSSQANQSGEEILQRLRGSTWVLFLASKAACEYNT